MPKVKTEITRSQIAEALGGRKFSLKSVSFGSMGSAYALTVTENGEQVRLGSIYTRAFLDSHQEALVAMTAVAGRHTYKGRHIL